MATKVLSNVKLMWCALGELDQYGKYGALLILDKEHVKKIKSWGLNKIETKLKKDDDGNVTFRVRRSEDKGPVVVKDKDLNVIKANPANGAVANVMLDVYEYKKFGGGTACRIEQVQLLQWEPYSGAGGSGEGFSVVDSDDEGSGSSEGDELF